MKLNTNGNYCLLYVEAIDEKQSLFATISEQHKPVFLQLSLEGQPRSGLFQLAEDFSELKQIRRQTGISIIFLTSGNRHLALMAARYGFPAYRSIDDFAELLLQGQSTASDKGYQPFLSEAKTTSQLVGPTRFVKPESMKKDTTGNLPDVSRLPTLPRLSHPSRPLQRLQEGVGENIGDLQEHFPVTSLASVRTTASRPFPGRTKAVFLHVLPEEGLTPVSPSAWELPRKRKNLGLWLIALLFLVISGGVLGSFMATAHMMSVPPLSPQRVGVIAFQSSEQFNENTNQGIDDQVQIHLYNLGTPALVKATTPGCWAIRARRNRLRSCWGN